MQYAVANNNFMIPRELLLARGGASLWDGRSYILIVWNSTMASGNWYSQTRAPSLLGNERSGLVSGETRGWLSDSVDAWTSNRATDQVNVRGLPNIKFGNGR